MDPKKHEIMIHYSKQDGWIATVGATNFPALDAINGHGDTPLEALREIRIALQGAIRVEMEDDNE